MVALSLNNLAQALQEAGIRQAFTPDVSRMTVELWRQIATGNPISPKQVDQIADNLGISREVAHSIIQKMCERDAEGNIVGVAGLSQKKHPHRFRVNGIRLSTWCALDALFLPVALKQSVQVESLCPQTKQKIQLTITPDGVQQYDPASAAISIVVPSPTQGGLESVEEIWMTFCNHIHFFSSQDAAREWFTRRGQEITVLSIEKGFEVGRLALEEVLQYA